MLAGDARLDAIVFKVPGVKMLRAPVPIPWSPWKTLVLEIESVIFSGERREPGRVGVNRTKTWHVLGGAPEAAGVRAARAGGAGNAVVGASAMRSG